MKKEVRLTMLPTSIAGLQFSWRFGSWDVGCWGGGELPSYRERVAKFVP